VIKKILYFVCFLWIGFLIFLIIGKEDEQAEPEEVVVSVPVMARDFTPVEKLEPIPAKPTPSESIPFEPLPDAPAPMEKRLEEKKVADVNQSTRPADRKDVPITKPKDFGLVCTLIEPIPSRFRFLKWQGSRYVWLEDLDKYNESSDSYPTHKFRVRVPYKEMLNPNTNESVFLPTTVGQKNARLFIQSLHVESKSLSYSGLSKPVGHLILRDFKIGGPSYQITNEQETPFTNTYRLHFEQTLGPQKFFHDLTGKPSDHKFGLWGFEYQVLKIKAGEGLVKVRRKNLKEFEYIEKELVAHNHPID
jgi:hypothetical protein